MKREKKKDVDVEIISERKRTRVKYFCEGLGDCRASRKPHRKLEASSRRITCKLDVRYNASRGTFEG